MEKNVRYGIFKVIATCPQCGHPVPVNGPRRESVCPSCQQNVPIPTGMWQKVLGEFEKEFDALEAGNESKTTLMGDLELKFSSVKLPPPDPACTQCESNWELEQITNGTDGVIICKNCGHTSPTFPAPEWLKPIAPTARQIFFGERDVDDPSKNAASPEAEADRPIAMTCPQCNGSLLITAQTERTLRCKYCNVDVFLPDALWLKLHPVKVAKFWLVRFQG